ncbi:unnamed protein product [Miscanthus lutarioriparius]|uniref:Uncharacterized protein n=1 Tax=Miscanthus lutarioriparius TaxID=422564 RepID=A0A811QC32_9POAL|nr:unnamed protein product [Miscanthus lutarioriparius]
MEGSQRYQGFKIEDSHTDYYEKYDVTSKESIWVKMVAEDSLSSLSSSEDELDFVPVDSKEIQHNSGSVSASMESHRKQITKERAIRLAPKFAS